MKIIAITTLTGITIIVNIITASSSELQEWQFYMLIPNLLHSQQFVFMGLAEILQ